MPNMYTLVAPCFFGTEHTLSFEVKRLGAQNVKVTDGRVAFEGDAAMIAAANLNLRTAEHYDFVPAAVWAEERQKALAASRLDAGFEGFGFDIDPNAVALANANAKLAGVGDRCRFEVADVKDFAPRPSSIILTNPPYGERLGDAAEAAALARTLGQVWQASPTAGLYAITADADFEAHFGKKAAKRRKIYNGMIPCQIYMYFDRPVKPVRK